MIKLYKDAVIIKDNYRRLYEDFFRTIFVFLLGWFNLELCFWIYYASYKIPSILGNYNRTDNIRAGIMVYQFAIFLYFAIQIVLLSITSLFLLFKNWIRKYNNTKNIPIESNERP